jgi:outer membrane receptor protein involved in Fe transport
MTGQRLAFSLVVGLAGALPAPALAADSSPTPIPEVTIDAKRFNEARDQIQPSLGATSFEFDRSAIEDSSQGENGSFNHLLLQAPGVTQDSYGQLHVRGEHANVQYRINGVQLPEGISVFGQVLQTRLADSVALITGSLPAQYGLRTSGVLDIRTRSGSLDPGGEVSFYGGSHDTIQPSAAYGGSIGNFDYFVTGDYQQNDLGIENPTGSADAIHDHTDQGKGFAYLTDRIDAETRVSLILASVRSQFQIPNNPNQTPTFAVNGVSSLPSALIDENQREITDFGVLTLQKASDDLNWQLSGFSRYSSVLFRPDALADLMFTGIAQDASRKVTSSGVQGDLSYKLNDRHTLRTGLLFQIERTTSDTSSSVLTTDATGAQTSQTPFAINQTLARTGMVGGVYLQDEWHPIEHLTVNYGARFDAVDEFTSENQLSPRVNLVYELTDTTTLHAGYSRYFTPPSFELVSGGLLKAFANTTAAPPNFQNRSPKSERSDYFDAGVTQTVTPELKVTIDGYYKAAHNLIDEGQFGSPILLTVFNYAEARQYGAEFSANYALGHLSLYGNIAYSYARGKNIVTSQFNFDPADLAYIQNNYIHLDHEQTFSASGGASYRIESTKTDLSLDFIYGTGLRRTVDNVPNGSSLPAYTQVNLGVAQQIPNDLVELEARFDLLNLLDEPGQLRDGSGVGVGAPQWGQRRAYYGGLTVRF